MLTIDRGLAYVMKMELDELIGFALDRYAAAGRVIHLDCVSVIDHLERGGMISELNRRQLLLLGVNNVDGGL
jgi:hypothetical protein